jgi:TM2 domain-containing membrane protein YozV
LAALPAEAHAEVKRGPASTACSTNENPFGHASMTAQASRPQPKGGVNLWVTKPDKPTPDAQPCLVIEVTMTDNNPPPRPRESGEPIPRRPAGDAGLPPHPLDKRWYAHIGGENYGPYTGHEIKQMVQRNQIVDSDFLCPEGGSSWTQAKNEPLLGALFRAQAQQPAVSTLSTNGGTIVQVTNQSPNANLAAALLLAGDAAPKSPGVALLLSFLFCGIGQMYNGQVGKGFAFLLGGILAWLILLGWVVWIWSMVDAYTTAKQMNLRYQQRILAGLM